MRKKLSITIIFMGIFVLLFAIRCSSSSSSGEDTLTDTQVDSVSKICSNMSRCFSGSYPAFFGKSKKECMSKLEEIVSSDDIDALLEAGSNCNNIMQIIIKYETTKGCEVIKACIDESKFTTLFKSIDDCAQYLIQNNIKEEELKCIDTNSSYCNLVTSDCLAKYIYDAGTEDVFTEDGGSNQKACITDLGTYYCEDVCDKYHECTGRYCPPEAEPCTKESCLTGCKTQDIFSIEIMCCIIESECTEISKCVPK